MNLTAASVLDASAFLAYLQDEAGSDHVERALGACAAMSAANWAEVLSKMSEAGEAPEVVTRRLEAQGILGTAMVIVPLDQAHAAEIARLRTATRAAGLSLGDRACLALGRLAGQPVVTTDRAWAGLRIAGVKVQVAR